MDLIVALLVLFGLARLAGEGMERIHQSPMLGEVFAGIVLGPMVLGLIDPNPSTDLGASLSVVATLGVFVLVLLAGIELGREGLRQAIHERSIVVAYVEFVLPFSLGYLFAQTLGFNLAQSLFLATAMAVTALPVSVRILLDLNLLHSRIGRAIVSVALANDLVAFGMLGLVVAFIQVGGTPPAATAGFIALKILLFAVLILCVGMILKRTGRSKAGNPSPMQRLLRKLKGQETAFAICVTLALLLGTAAESVGIHFAVGVFYAGVLITPQLMGREEFGPNPQVHIRGKLRAPDTDLLRVHRPAVLLLPHRMAPRRRHHRHRVCGEAPRRHPRWLHRGLPRRSAPCSGRRPERPRHDGAPLGPGGLGHGHHRRGTVLRPHHHDDRDDLLHAASPQAAPQAFQGGGRPSPGRPRRPDGNRRDERGPLKRVPMGRSGLSRAILGLELASGFWVASDFPRK